MLLKNGSSYPGPYKDRSKNLMGLSAVTTPDNSTIQFHLAQPFPDFNYVVAFSNTAPVPPSKDTGTNYQLNVQSTGPYMFQSYSLNKQAVLVPNPKWKPSWDTEAKQLASKIVIDLNVNANDLDNRLLAGDINVDAAGHRRAGPGPGQDPEQQLAQAAVRRPARPGSCGSCTSAPRSRR